MGNHQEFCVHERERDEAFALQMLNIVIILKLLFQEL
jgi:hypothetical protein